MLARCLLALVLSSSIVCASPHVRIRAENATASNATAPNAPFISTSAAAPPSNLLELPANVSTIDRPRPKTTHRLPSNGTHNSTHRPTHHPTHRVTQIPHPIPRPAQTVQPGDVHPHHVDGPPSPHAHHKGPNIAQTFFEVLGGVAGLLVLVAIARCFYKYKRTPSGRRSPTPEIDEVDRRLAMLRNPWRPIDLPPPPPPYQHAPDYENEVHTPVSHPPSPRPPDHSGEI